MYIYYPSCNFSAASPATAKKVKAYFEKQMPVAGCCRVDKREISSADIALYICQACRETLEDKVKTQSMWEYLDALKDFNFPNLNGQKFYVQDCWRDRNHPEIHEAVRSLLKKMHAEVMDGDQVTLTGRTGAGKSTIFKLLLGLYKPQSGEVLIHGVPAADIRDDERRRLFGCVEQTFHMVPGTVRDQITLYDSTISDEAVHTAAELTGLKDTIESMEKGYDTRCTDDLFSQGQWQLLSIARAAAAAPSMLLFDEITANLDAETERAVLSALKRVAENRTVISISHRTSAELGRIIALTD